MNYSKMTKKELINHAKILNGEFDKLTKRYEEVSDQYSILATDNQELRNDYDRIVLKLKGQSKKSQRDADYREAQKTHAENSGKTGSKYPINWDTSKCERFLEMLVIFGKAFKGKHIPMPVWKTAQRFVYGSMKPENADQEFHVSQKQALWIIRSISPHWSEIRPIVLQCAPAYQAERAERLAKLSKAS